MSDDLTLQLQQLTDDPNYDSDFQDEDNNDPDKYSLMLDSLSDDADYQTLEGGADTPTKPQPSNGTVTIKSIEKQLSDFNTLDKVISVTPDKIEYNDKTQLEINGEKLNMYCLFHLIGGTNFLDKYKDLCADINKKLKIVTKNADGKTNINYSNFIKLSSNNDINYDVLTYERLYEFILEQAKFITENQEFLKEPVIVKNRIIIGFREFIKQTLTYSQELMRRYKVINDKN